MLETLNSNINLRIEREVTRQTMDITNEFSNDTDPTFAERFVTKTTL